MYKLVGLEPTLGANDFFAISATTGVVRIARLLTQDQTNKKYYVSMASIDMLKITY